MVCDALPAGMFCSFQIPGGQSCDVDSPNYEDLLPDWLAHEPMPLVLDVAEAKANAVREQTLGDSQAGQRAEAEDERLKHP
jgi:acyl-homoserine lactone acylase PvdQ